MVEVKEALAELLHDEPPFELTGSAAAKASRTRSTRAIAPLLVAASVAAMIAAIATFGDAEKAPHVASDATTPTEVLTPADVAAGDPVAQQKAAWTKMRREIDTFLDDLGVPKQRTETDFSIIGDRHRNMPRGQYELKVDYTAPKGKLRHLYVRLEYAPGVDLVGCEERPEPCVTRQVETDRAAIIFGDAGGRMVMLTPGAAGTVVSAELSGPGVDSAEADAFLLGLAKSIATDPTFDLSRLPEFK